MTRRITRLATLGLVIAAMVAIAAVPASAKSTKTEVSKKVVVSGAALATSDAVGTSKDPAIGKTGPTLSGQGFDGMKVRIGGTSEHGRVLIFVAHWCPHCQAEVPKIVKLAKQGKLAGIDLQTIATDTNKELPNYPPSKWLSREKWPFTPVLADDAKDSALQAYGGTSFPFFVLLDANNKVVVRTSGEIPPAALAQAVKNLAAGKPVFGSN